ncbi:MAG TPA: thiol peroxidase [bacterium]|nr:thiol peroxidase [bacterium]
MDRPGAVTMRGAPLTLTGNELKAGDAAPDFTAVDNGLAAASLADFKGKTLIIASVPSLDTPVCEIETKKFNQEAGALGEAVRVLTISMDLPFAQKRWCAAEGVTNLTTLSDHRDASFGTAYGVLIKELRLLARAVFVVGKDGIVKHAQIVKEIGHEPDYEAALAAAKAAM